MNHTSRTKWANSVEFVPLHTLSPLCSILESGRRWRTSTFALCAPSEQTKLFACIYSECNGPAGWTLLLNVRPGPPCTGLLATHESQRIFCESSALIRFLHIEDSLLFAENEPSIIFKSHFGLTSIGRNKTHKRL